MGRSAVPDGEVESGVVIVGEGELYGLSNGGDLVLLV